jgi:transcriptional regulator with XRE-family HTH domain
MGSKLNPDGTKIRILRIQRGWTQEQLAEIAGISSRTVQRAETANCAAFETVRAIAGAFGTDFDQLLNPEACRASEPEPRISPAQLPSPDIELEPIEIEPPKPTARRMLTTLLVAISTLVAGLVTGVILRSRLDMHERPNLSALPAISVTSPQVRASPELARRETVSRQAEPVRRVPAPINKASVPSRTANIAEGPRNPGSAEQPTEITATADLDSQDQDIVPHSHIPRLLDLSSQSESLLSTPMISESPLAWSDLPGFPDDLTRDGSDLGPVRQAINVAAKKTGAFVSKVGTSVKRVF